MQSNHKTDVRRWRLPALLASLSLLVLALQPVFAAKPVTPTFVDYAQCANGAPPSTDLDCPEGWINGILQASNSHYSEDQVTPQRAEVNVPAGAATTVGSHSMTFTYQARKGSAQTHAYDSLATWNWTQTAADRCEGLNPNDCVSGDASTFPIPADTTALEPHTAPSGTSTATHMLPASSQAECDAYATTIPSRCFEMYGGIIDSVSAYTHSCTATSDCANPNVDDYATVTILYHTTSVPQKVQLLFGGHLAQGTQGGSRTWGLGFGSSNISGGPYHIKWTASDGESIGNRDNQIMGSAIIFQDTSISTQVKNTNGADPDTDITDGAHVNIGTVAYDTATLSGNTSDAAGTVTYYVEQDASCTIAGATSLGTKTVTNGVVPNSDNHTFASSGTYEFWAVYSGDGNNNTSTSTCGSETVVVNANTTTATQVKNTNGADPDTDIADGTHVNIGTIAYDTATLSGNTSDAAGTVTYYVEKGDASCTIAGATSLGAKTVAAGVVPASDNYTFTSSGTYEFWAVYSGDTNNNGSTSTCLTETVIVNADTATTTQVKNTNATEDTGDDTNIADGAHVNIGTVAYDTATLSGNTSDAGGTVTYYVEKGDASCTILGASSLGAKTVTNGVVPNSNNYTFTSAGTYEFWAVYNGDGNNNGSTSTCGSETVVVNPNTNGISTAQSLVPNDSATLTGLTSDAGGTITFKLFPPSNATCSTAEGATAPLVDQTLNVSGAQSTYTTTNTLAATAQGTWRWQVIYTGDANNGGATSACGVETFSIDNDTTN